MPSSNLAEAPPSGGKTRAALPKAVWLCLGLFCVVVGVIGVFVPLLPTTGPLILALACFARSSPSLEGWLLNHPRFGPGLRLWREFGAVPRAAKVFTCLGMTLGFAVFWLTVRPSLLVSGMVGAGLTLCAAYVVSRPAPPSGAQPDGV